jgi:uncharacterized coiled-coil DUF342 family protein
MKVRKTRAEIINEAKRIRAECQQIFTDCEHWNSNVRKPHEAQIDPDPDGQLKRTIQAVDKMLEGEIRVCNP